MKILVGSRNPVKIAAVAEAFGRCFGAVEVTGIAVDSGVPDQPGGEQTFAGAANRAAALARRNAAEGLQAAFCVGLEAGMIQLAGTWFTFGAICLVDDRGRIGQATSGMFPLPPGLVPEMLAGVELGTLIDRLAGEENTKQRGGAVGYLTGGILDRQGLYAQGVLLALIPFLSGNGLYFPE